MSEKKVRVIRSVPEKGRYFEKSAVEMSADPNVEMRVINLYDDLKYQSVLGFGGAFTESAAYNYAQLSDTEKQRFLKLYFDPKDGIGYNLGRLHIAACDFSLETYYHVKDGDTALDDFSLEHDKRYIIPFVKDILAYCPEEIFLFASPWSPPGYMKDNGSAVGGGKLAENYKAVWAKYYARFIKAYAAEGIRISAITVQNEPNATQTWESCRFTAEEEAAFLEKYLIPTLDAEGLEDVKLIIWDHNKERVYDRSVTTLASPAVRERVWGVGYHWYSGNHFEALRMVHERFGKALICTEFCTSMKNSAMASAEKYAVEMCGNFNNYQNASCDWNVLLSSEGGPYHNRSAESVSTPGAVFDGVKGGCNAPILYDGKAKKLILTPTYYYIGHFSKYVKRGAKRLAVTRFTEAIHVCAFENPNGSIAVQVVNTSDSDIPFFFRCHGECAAITAEAHSMMTLLL